MNLTQLIRPSFLYRRVLDWLIRRNPEFSFVRRRLLAFSAAQKCDRDEHYWAQVLRMNAHFLDKGICRPDSEPGHAEQPYQAAKDALTHISHKRLLLDPSLQWACTVISHYENLQLGGHFQPPILDPALPPETPEVLRSLILGRRSARWFSEQPVTESTLREIVSVVNWAPSSCNRQPVAIFASVQPETVTKCVASCKGATGFGAFIPCFIAFCADLRTYALPEEAWMPFIDVALGVQNCCLMAHTLGASLTLLNWAHHSDEEEDSLRAALQITRAYEIVVNAVLGYPKHGIEPPLRKTEDSTLFVR